jgi:DNA polymerase iota
MDNLEISKVPGIGFKIAQKIRTHVPERQANFENGLVYSGTKENLLVREVRQHPGMGPETLERLLGGPGVPCGIGLRIWELINGCDATEVGQAREVPTQISIEDSYIRLDTLDEVTKELRLLATSLLKRMHTDLVEDKDDEHTSSVRTLPQPALLRRWLAYPRSIRLSTRPRPPQNPDGSRNRSFARISKSTPMPGFVFSLKDDVSSIVERLVAETLLPLFRRLHPERSGWNLSLMNVAAANIAGAASEKGGIGRDIAKMFRRQDDVLKQWKFTEDGEVDVGSKGIDRSQSSLPGATPRLADRQGSEDIPTPSQEANEHSVDYWGSEEEDMVDVDTYGCEECGAIMPLFALGAHERWHAQG